MRDSFPVFPVLEKLIENFKDRIHVNCPVSSVTRHDTHVTVTSPQGPQDFDEVVIATHSDQALKLLTDPTDLEKDILQHFPYQKNEAFLHTDQSIMPKNKRAWASWNYYISKEKQHQACVTYHMNRLQSIKSKEEYFVLE